MYLPVAQLDSASDSDSKVEGSNPFGWFIKTHAKGAYKALLRVSFSMQSRDHCRFWGSISFCCFFAYHRMDLFFSRFGKSQTFNDWTKRIFTR